MKIIYLHGFNSTGDGSTALELKKVYSNLITISYDYANADNAFKEIDKLIIDTLRIDKDILLIGSSMGGFWANLFGQKYDLKMVLINPAIHPNESLKKHIGEITNFVTNVSSNFTQNNVNTYNKYLPETKSEYFRYIILGKNDEIIDYKKTKKYFKNKGLVFMTNWGHRVGDFSELKSYIDKAINNYYTIEN